MTFPSDVTRLVEEAAGKSLQLYYKSSAEFEEGDTHSPYGRARAGKTVE